MNSQELQEELRATIIDGDEARAAELAYESVGDPAGLPAVVQVAVDTIKLIGDRFGTGECFLPEMVLSAEAMLAFMHIASPHLEKATGKASKAGKVVLGTVQGDIHTIGKDIVLTMLSASGFDVVDMGVDASPIDVIKTAEQTRAQIIGLSALMTTSMPYQEETIALLRELGIRDKFWVMVGGGPVTVEYARRIGADGWAPDAGTAVRVCEQLLAGGAKPGSGLVTGEGRTQ